MLSFGVKDLWEYHLWDAPHFRSVLCFVSWVPLGHKNRNSISSFSKFPQCESWPQAHLTFLNFCLKFFTWISYFLVSSQIPLRFKVSYLDCCFQQVPSYPYWPIHSPLASHQLSHSLNEVLLFSWLFLFYNISFRDLTTLSTVMSIYHSDNYISSQQIFECIYLDGGRRKVEE